MGGIEDPVTVTLTVNTAGALRSLLDHETIRIERWMSVHGRSLKPETIQDSRTYLEQLRTLQRQLEAGIKGRRKAIRQEASGMNGQRGGRPRRGGEQRV